MGVIDSAGDGTAGPGGMRARASSDRLGPPGPSAIITRPSRMTHAARTRPPARRTYRPRRRARVIAVLVLAVAVALAAGGAYLLLGRDEGPTARDALDGFAAAWSRGDDRGAAADTTQPAVAAKALVANRKGLDGAKLRATVTSVTKAGDDAERGRLRLTWQVPEFGRFAYTTRVTLHRDDEHGWRVDWRPAVVHPVLDGTNRLGTAIDRPGRASILDRDGRPLVTERAVVRVGVARNKVTDVEATAAAVAKAVGIDASDYARAIRNAGPQQFVEAVTLRASEYDAKKAALDGIAGLQTIDDTAALGPTKGFARAVLGTVGPITAEQLEKLGPTYGPGAEVGQTGLEARFEKQLAGTPTRKVITRLNDGEADDTLAARRGTPGKAVRTTLDRDVQTAAERALGSSGAAAALVAVRPSTGDVLAVANRPTNSTFDRALGGRYPPGSTFKIVSTAALLRDGLNPDATVVCPQTINVGGRTFKNFEGEASGAVAVQPGLRAVVQHRVREPLGPPAGRRAARHGARLRPRPQGQAAADGRRQPGPAGRRPRRARGGDDRPGAHPREPAADGGRRGDGRRRALARAAAREHRPAGRRAGGVARGPRPAAVAHARGRDARDRHGAGRRVGRADRQERHRGVRLGRPAAHARVVRRGPR